MPYPYVLNMHLRREIGLLGATFYGVGLILGAGVYALIGEAAGLAGNALWLSFLLGAFISSFTGLSYIELSSMFPMEAAEYVYFKKATGRESLAFLIGWVEIFAEIVAAATVALGFAGYFRSIFDLPTPFIAILLILFLSVLNFCGIEESSRFNILFTLVEVSGLILIVALGVFFGDILTTNYLETPSIAGVFGCAALTLFAYLGFEDVVHISEEIKHPIRNVPRALILSLIISTIIYALVSVSVVGLVNWRELGASEAPLAFATSKVLGKDASTVLTFIALFATANTVLILLLVSSKIMYGMAVDGSLPKVLAKINKKTGTPSFSIIAVMVLSVLFAFLGDIKVVANVTNFVTFIVFSSVNISCILLRHAKPELERPLRTPLNIGKYSLIPFIGLFSCGFLITQLDQPSILLGILILITGGVAYRFLKRKNRLP